MLENKHTDSEFIEKFLKDNVDYINFQGFHVHCMQVTVCLTFNETNTHWQQILFLTGKAIIRAI